MFTARCIAFDVRPILWPFIVRPLRSSSCIQARWIAEGSSIVISGESSENWRQARRVRCACCNRSAAWARVFWSMLTGLPSCRSRPQASKNTGRTQDVVSWLHLFGLHDVAQHAHAADFDLDHIARPQELRRFEADARADRRAGGDDVARRQRSEGGDVLDEPGAAEPQA